jgi:hypothetical protein
MAFPNILDGFHTRVINIFIKQLFKFLIKKIRQNFSKNEKMYFNKAAQNEFVFDFCKPHMFNLISKVFYNFE